MTLGETQCNSPGLTIRFHIDADRQQGEIIQRSIAEDRIVTPAANSHFQYIRHFETPKRRHPRSAIAHRLENLSRRLRCLIVINPCQSNGTIDDDAHGRPASRSAFNTSQSKPAFSLAARARIRSAAANACARSIPPVLGTSRATGLPCLVMTISSPFSTRSRREPSVFLASKAPTSITLNSLAQAGLESKYSFCSRHAAGPTSKAHLRPRETRPAHNPPVVIRYSRTHSSHFSAEQPQTDSL